ncbi:hypothetical protein HOLleu_44903 [Holothuria leucospilota]|uniref:Uncharacterized protein n=1 Tax=Holothuria leucospilota TaxID=206669 RepID=A0A9Q1B966_HOLLE|nr:hypothetical protein HOLleu_44903 [Holothuria leucospilota]
MASGLPRRKFRNLLTCSFSPWSHPSPPTFRTPRTLSAKLVRYKISHRTQFWSLLTCPLYIQIYQTKKASPLVKPPSDPSKAKRPPRKT